MLKRGYQAVSCEAFANYLVTRIARGRVASGGRMKQGRDFQVIAGLLAVAMAIGGAGDSFPLLEMLLELCALATLGYFALTRRSWTLNLETRLAFVLLGLVLLLPILQLIPCLRSCGTGFLAGRQCHTLTASPSRDPRRGRPPAADNRPRRPRARRWRPGTPSGWNRWKLRRSTSVTSTGGRLRCSAPAARRSPPPTMTTRCIGVA